MTTRLNHEEQRRAAREAADLTHVRELRARRETQELEVLVKANEALHRLGRAAGRAHHADLVANRTTGEPYGKTRLDEDVNNELFEAGRETLLLGHLIVDDDVRANYEQARHLWKRPGVARSETDAHSAFDTAIEAADRAHEAIGARIRDIYGGAEH